MLFLNVNKVKLRFFFFSFLHAESAKKWESNLNLCVKSCCSMVLHQMLLMPSAHATLTTECVGRTRQNMGKEFISLWTHLTAITSAKPRVTERDTCFWQKCWLENLSVESKIFVDRHWRIQAIWQVICTILALTTKINQRSLSFLITNNAILRIWLNITWNSFRHQSQMHQTTVESRSQAH